MLQEHLQKALLRLYDMLEGLDWALSGSANLALQGMERTPNDLDIVVAHEVLGRARELLAAYNPSSIEPLPSGTGEHFTVWLDGTEVDILGEPEDGMYAPETERTFVEVQNKRIPLYTLAAEERAYRRMGREERAAEIARFRQ